MASLKELLRGVAVAINTLSQANMLWRTSAIRVAARHPISAPDS